MLLTAVCEVPLALLERSLKEPLIAVRFPLSFDKLPENMLSPTKKETLFIVTFPLRRSSVKMASEQPMFSKEGPTLEDTENPK